MARGAVVTENETKRAALKNKCAICKERPAAAPRDEKKYCEKCWEARVEKREQEKGKFDLSRYLRTDVVETYFIRHKESKDYPTACGELYVFEDRKTSHFILRAVLHPTLDWQKVCYKDAVTEVKVSELLVEVATEVIEAWGGGRWDMQLFYTTERDGCIWEGEV